VKLGFEVEPVAFVVAFKVELEELNEKGTCVVVVGAPLPKTLLPILDESDVGIPIPTELLELLKVPDDTEEGPGVVEGAPPPNGVDDGFDEAADVEPGVGAEEMPKLNVGGFDASGAAAFLSPPCPKGLADDMVDGNALDVPPNRPKGCGALTAPVSALGCGVLFVAPKENFNVLC